MIAQAYVNWGRWVADCPFGCPGVPGFGSELALRDWFVCGNCKNAANEGIKVPLVWPEPEHVRAIESALLPRPIEARNWNVDESIGALLAENVMHGLFDGITGEVYGDIGADQSALPGIVTSLALGA